MVQHQTIRVLLSLGLAGLTLGGCGYKYEEVDADGDGYFLNGDEPDCWDAVEGPAGSGLSGKDIHPGVDDRWYDGVDANCDGADDYDQDGDGVRCNPDATGDEAGCALDCDDTDPTVNPGAVEVCTDGVDNDCDGLEDTDDVDDGDGASDAFENTAFYLDTDADGYGDESKDKVFQESCTAPAGYSVYGGDCDDVDDEIKPGADERCDDVDSDCDGDARDADSLDAGTWYGDADDDGYGGGTSTATACDAPTGYAALSDDCDDGDAAVNPGADEICDADDVDEDCDGFSDDDDPDGFLESSGTAYYPDEDGDGFGDDASPPVLQCEPVADHVTEAGDCDDSRADVNPDGAEVCDDDDVDEDCDGLINTYDDSSDAATWYPDEDGDGFGGAAGVRNCEEPDGYVAVSGDCDDELADVYPGAPETCGDGVRSNCSEDDLDARDECLDAAGSLGDANAVTRHSTKSTTMASTLTGAGDVDGDGLADLLVGATELSGGAGGVWLVSMDGRSGEFDVDVGATARFTSNVSKDYLGAALAGGGDVDDDGYADLLMTATGEDFGGTNAGGAWLVLGPVTSTGLVDDASETLLYGATPTLELGTAALLADLTDDGVADLVVGAAEYDTSTRTSVGAVYLVEGPPAAGDLSVASVDVLMTGDKSGDRAGSALAAPGDMDGDGVSDLAIGVPEANESTGTDSGKVWMVWGPVDTSGALSTDIADYTVKGTAADDLAGTALASAGDVNDDGYADLWVGAPGATAGSTAGAAYLVLGDLLLAGSLTLSAAEATLNGVVAGDLAGSAIAGLDVNADGHPDVVVGAPGADDGSDTEAGAAYVVYGPVAGTRALSAADLILYGEVKSDAAGTALANVSDTDGDGVDDLLIGAPGYDLSAAKTDVGAAYLFTTWY